MEVVQYTDADEQRLQALLRAQYGGEDLDAFIRRVSPRHPPPRHIAPIMELWERSRHERVFACVELPPRCAKTTTGLHGIAYRLAKDPAVTCGFASYNDSYAASRSRIGRVLARAGGVQFDKSMANLHEWRTTHGGGLLAHGYHGEWTGQGITGVALLDDLFKDRASAESPKIRENIWEWFTDVLWTRLEPGSSVIAQMTRWHDDDLIGRLLQGKFKGYRFEEIRLPAIAEEDDILGRAPGEALWPEMYPIEVLRKTEVSVGPYTWASLFQQRPRPRGANVFHDVGRFSLATWTPTDHRLLLCCDPAATEDTRADFSAAFILAASGYGREMKIWILHGWRDHVSVPAVAAKLLEISLRYRHAPVIVESVGGFKAVPQILKECEPRLKIVPIKPVGDKFTRAQAVAAAWNTGRVFVPIDSELDIAWTAGKMSFELPSDPTTGVHFRRPIRRGLDVDTTWADELIFEANRFTGVGDLEDDQIDAIAHGYNYLFTKMPARRGQHENTNPYG